ncbi:hypothetical protein [Enterococcus avium]|uniref:hypothetical protein n=1 Tax=Enterococcus avium TaxID=33945 RepID=UPI0028921A36|nr:hypothetical protein [Enterococcus avium]MDT2457555.1 hypothetical protein [Enterococcus avium]
MIVETDTKLSNSYKGNIKVIKESNFQLFGMVLGDIQIHDNSTCNINGMVSGDITIFDNAIVKINGTVTGTVINNGGIVDIYGIVGNLIDTAGKTTVHKNAVIQK